MTSSDRIPEGVLRIRAPNASPLTLDGTNTYVVDGHVIDPGPADEGHLRAVLDAAGRVEAVVLTHTHPDHAEGAEPLARLAGGVPVVLPAGEERVGPLEAHATPGHAKEHVCLLHGRTLFSGDTVLGEGSVFVDPGPGSLAAYLDSLRRLRELDLEVICPGHGPCIWDPRAKLDEYLEHRLERERLLLDALATGARSEEELLDRAWADVPSELRFGAAWTLRAHLQKLGEEGRLPEDLDGLALSP